MKNACTSPFYIISIGRCYKAVKNLLLIHCLRETSMSNLREERGLGGGDVNMKIFRCPSLHCCDITDVGDIGNFKSNRIASSQ